MPRVLIAFGANLGDRRRTFELARELITKRVGQVLVTSDLIETEPWVLAGQDPNSQPKYLNAVIKVDSSLQPDEILGQLLKIESELGRVRGKDSVRWAARTIDLDLLAVENLIVNSIDLTLPHPELHKRQFVLEPLMQVWPEWTHPILGVQPAEFLRRLNAGSTQYK